MRSGSLIALERPLRRHAIRSTRRTRGIAGHRAIQVFRSVSLVALECRLRRHAIRSMRRTCRVAGTARFRCSARCRWSRSSAVSGVTRFTRRAGRAESPRIARFMCSARCRWSRSSAVPRWARRASRSESPGIAHFRLVRAALGFLLREERATSRRRGARARRRRATSSEPTRSLRRGCGAHHSRTRSRSRRRVHLTAKRPLLRRRLRCCRRGGTRAHTARSSRTRGARA